MTHVAIKAVIAFSNTSAKKNTSFHSSQMSRQGDVLKKNYSGNVYFCVFGEITLIAWLEKLDMETFQAKLHQVRQKWYTFRELISVLIDCLDCMEYRALQANRPGCVIAKGGKEAPLRRFILITNLCSSQISVWNGNHFSSWESCSSSLSRLLHWPVMKLSSHCTCKQFIQLPLHI